MDKDMIVNDLLHLGLRWESPSHRALIRAAEAGLIERVECMMGLGQGEEDRPGCVYPQELGGREYFEPKTPGDWVPSVDRYPLPGYRGGTYVMENVRLAHRLCNHVDYAYGDHVPYKKELDRVAALTVDAELKWVDDEIRRLQERRERLVKHTAI